MKVWGRALLVWLHVLTSVGWMSQALGLFALTSFGVGTGDRAARLSAFTMAQLLDKDVLLYLANTSAFTGLMLSALTPWGYFRHWWVLGKFAITVSQLYVGIFVLSPNLDAAARAAETGQPQVGGSALLLTFGTLLMAGAIAFQGWLSVAKPWKRTPWAINAATAARAPKKLPTAPGWTFLACTAIPVVDYLVGSSVGAPTPFLSLLTVLGYPVWRSRQFRRAASPSGVPHR